MRTGGLGRAQLSWAEGRRISNRAEIAPGMARPHTFGQRRGGALGMLGEQAETLARVEFEWARARAASQGHTQGRMEKGIEG